MKLLLLSAAILAAAASVQGGSFHPSRTDPTWMLIPGEDGSPHVAILRGPVPQREARIDPVNDVKFFLYTRSNRNNPVQINVGNLHGSAYDGSKQTKFLIHGFTSDANTDFVIGMKNDFLSSQDVNIIAVDWSGPASGPLYNVARGNVKEVGDYVAQMHNYLGNQGGAPGRTHCIGHSLGAHVCGFSGKSSSGNLNRITGMDPALPLFDINTPAERLSTGDANYVDVIHSCGGWLGFDGAIGHADFYPNGGQSSQPGCGADVTGACSHGRSHEFMLESISSSRFNSRQCSSWANFESGSCNGNTAAVMGNPSPSNTRGTFYLATAAASPFALG